MDTFYGPVRVRIIEGWLYEEVKLSDNKIQL